METETLERPPNTPEPPGFGPTPDPTRSGAMWVGGAGVALLLAAAAVLTAVRWDDIGQSVKLGGMVTITLLLLGAGRRFRAAIPMTAEAIFHLGALLIPFDMAAVAILAGRTWQETLLLTSVVSVGAWYGIERSVPSPVLKWCARGAVVVLTAGIAAVSSVTMPLALAIAAALSLMVRKTTAAVGWAAIAAALPLASFFEWPSRIAGAMSDLGFERLEQWQALAAGVIAAVVLAAATRLVPRIEIAWAAVMAAVLTASVALGGFSDAQASFLSLAALFLGLELLALVAARDPLWKPIVDLVAGGGEIVAAGASLILLGVVVMPAGFDFVVSPTTIGMSSVLFGLGWLTADRRRLDDDADWLTATVMGSDWPIATVMFPFTILTAALGFAAPAFAFSITAVALAYWMVATWRSGGTYGALFLVGLSVLSATQTTAWVELALAAIGASVLMVAAQLRVRRNDPVEALIAAVGGVFAWMVGSASVVNASDARWSLLLVVVGAWALGWIVEARGVDRVWHPADWVGRLTAGVTLALSLHLDAAVALSMCLAVIVLAAIDYALLVRSGAAETNPLFTAYALTAGTALGTAGVPITALAGLGSAATGAALAVAGFIVAGIALVCPRKIELPLGATAFVTSAIGIGMALGDSSMLAIALLAVGCTIMFVGAALRDMVFGIAGYVTVGVGVALQLAVWDVMWLEPYLVMPALAAVAVGRHYHREGGNSWAAYAPTIALFSYVAIADRFTGGSAWHAVIAGTVGVLAIIGGGYRRLVGPLVTGSVVLALVVGYESLGPAALVPTWAWLATGGTVLLAAGVVMEQSDTSPLERGQQIRNVIATQFS